MLERIEVNLLPAEYRIHRTRLRLHREIMYPLGLVLLAAAVMAVWMITLTSAISSLNQQIAAVEEEIERDKHVLEEIKVLREQKAQIGEKIQALKRIDVNREKWVRLLEVLAGNLPRNMWLNHVEEKGESLLLKGRTFSFPEVASYMTRLGETEYVQSVDVADIKHRDGSGGVFDFTITCELNPDAGLLMPVMPETQVEAGQ
jgi:Tfp pilus assembly protein PilN